MNAVYSMPSTRVVSDVVDGGWCMSIYPYVCRYVHMYASCGAKADVWSYFAVASVLSLLVK